MRELSAAIYGVNIVVLQWYSWIALAALGVILLGAFWIFYDSQRKNTEPLLWKVLIVVAVVFIIPSVAVGLDERIAQNVIHAIALLAYLGIGATVIGLISILGYLAKIGYNAEGEADMVGAPTVYAPPLGSVGGPSLWPPPTPGPGLPAQPSAPGPTQNIGSGGLGGAIAGGMMGESAGGVIAAPLKTELLQKIPEEVAYLVVRSGPRAGKEYRLADVTTIGRDGQQCDLVLDDTSASSQHARVKLENGKFVLHDLASTNGTKVNNSPIDRHVLADGDQINIGRTTLTFVQVNLGQK